MISNILKYAKNSGTFVSSCNSVIYWAFSVFGPAGPSPWLALWYGMVSHWLSGHFLECSPRNSFSNLKQHYSARWGWERFWVAPLEEALYKCMQWMNEWMTWLQLRSTIDVLKYLIAENCHRKLLYTTALNHVKPLVMLVPMEPDLTLLFRRNSAFAL